MTFASHRRTRRVPCLQPWVGMLTAALAALSTSAYAGAEPRVALPRASVPSVVWSSHDAGAVPASNAVSFEIVLPLRNQATLDDLLQHLYTPGDPQYGQFLTPAQFKADFGPTDADVNTVAGYAAGHGLTVKSVAPNNTAVRVSGSAQAVKSAFGIALHNYVAPNGRAYFAPSTEPLVPASIAGKISGFLGLNTSKVRHSSARPTPNGASTSTVRLDSNSGSAFSSPNGEYFSGHQGMAPNDIKSTYGLSGFSYTGTGQVAGLFEVGTFTLSDITTYENYYGLPHIPINVVSVDGYNTASAPGADAFEVTLDIDMIAALAPGVSQIRVYEASDSASADFAQEEFDEFTAMANDAVRPNVISVSYGASEIYYTAAEVANENTALQQLAAQGQSVFVASGDAGAYTDQSTYPSEAVNCSDPAAQPYVTAVGGTDLLNTSLLGYVSENSWADTADHGRGLFGTGSGGGISRFWSIPSWQVGAFTSTSNPQGSSTLRNVPDVALFGDYDTGGYDLYFASSGGWGGANGTSASSPLWAAYVACVNQARLAAGGSVVGFANPVIYPIAENSSKFLTDFHDVLTGNNLFYNAVAGYDNANGWGSFNGINLLRDIAPPPGVNIAGFAPMAASIGQSVTVSGSNLSGATLAKVNGTTATITANTATSLTLTVPTGATTGPIAITTPSGTATSGTNLTLWTGTLTISGNVFNDVNGNGTKDAGEVGASGWTVYVDKFGNGGYAPTDPTAVTDASGNFTIKGLSSASAVSVNIAALTGWHQSLPDYKFSGYSVPLTSSFSGLSFGETQTNAIRGIVYKDVNTNGTRDGGDTALSGWAVSVDATHTATSASDGTFEINGLTASNVTLTLTVQPGWQVTQPSSGNSWGITYASTGGIAQLVPFGLKNPAPATPTGFTATAGVSQVVLNWQSTPGAVTYSVYRSTISGGETLYQSGRTGTSYTDTGVTNGTTYYYKLTAVNPTGESGKTAEKSATPFALVPPSTAIGLAGTAGTNGWYKSGVTVTLTPTAGTYAIANTFYTVDGGAQQTYSAPFTVSGDATHSVVYWSVDVNSNAETQHTQSIKIDATAPSTSNSVTAGTVTLTASDATAGVASTFYTIDSGAQQTYSAPFAITSAGSHTVAYWSVDNAGNVESQHTVNVVITGPTTAIGLSGTAGTNGWYTSDVTVTLTPTAGTYAIANTFYTVDGGAQQTYSAPFTVSGDGTHTVVYWSVDVNSNAETTHNQSIKIDATPPSTTNSVSSGTVTLTATDATSGVAQTFYTIDGGAQQTYSAPFSIASAGSHTVAYWSVDNAGNVESQHSVNVGITGPTTAIGLGGTAGTNGWYTSSVTVTLTPTAGTYAIANTFYTVDGGAQQTYSVPFTVSGDGTHSVVYWSVDVNSNTETSHNQSIKIDVTAPTLAFGTPTPAANGAGWNKASVSISYTPSDATSGVASALPGSPITFTGEGANQTQTVTVTDNAGNRHGFTSPAVNIDLTAPSTTATPSGTQSGGVYSTPVSITLAGSDPLSGVASTLYTVDGGAQQTYSAPFTVSGNGSHSVVYWSVDVAGNIESQHSLSLTISTGPTQQSTLTTLADAYVQGGTSAATNFGTATSLQVKNSSSGTTTRWTYLKFDLTTLPGPIQSAKLQLFGNSSNTSADSDTVYSVADTTWTETGITWNNKPSTGSSLSSTSVGTTKQSYLWDVGSYLAAQQSGGHNVVTLAVEMDAVPAANQSDSFNSKEAGSNAPQLLVTYAVPAPTVAAAAQATPNPVNGTHTALTVLGASINGESTLSYTWASTGPAPVIFIVNGSNAAKNTTAYFSQTGSYTFTATITDQYGQTATSSVTVPVTIPTSTTTVNVTALADSYVNQGSTATNYGTATSLLVKNSTSGSTTRWAYFKFDTSTIPGPISAAKLQLFGNSANTTADSDTAYGVADTSWTESGITWANKPAPGASVASTSVGTTKQYYLWDVGSYLAAHSGVVSFAVQMDAVPAGNQADSFNSKEAGANPPVLAVTFPTSAPTISTAASATPNPVVNASTTALSVLAAYGGGESQLTYTWSATGPAAVVFSANGTNAAKNSTATFSQSGTYTFTVVATDPNGLTAASQVTVPVTVPVSNAQAILTPLADTYVNQGATTTNYGTATAMLVKNSTSGTTTRWIFLKFDLTSVTGPISSATLNLTGKSLNTSADSDTVYGVADTTWTETGLTWANKPAVGASIGSASVGTTQQLYSWNVGSYLAAQKAAGHNLVTLAVEMDAVPAANQADTFNSKEAGVNVPSLVVNYAG